VGLKDSLKPTWVSGAERDGAGVADGHLTKNVPFNMGLGRGFRGAGYAGAGGMYSPYTGYGMMSSGNSYGGGGSYGGDGSYRGGGQGSSSYAGSYPPYGADAASLTPYGEQAPATTRPDTVLESFGVKTQGGTPVWPLGIRILAPASEARSLARQVDALLEWSVAKGGGLGQELGLFKILPSRYAEVKVSRGTRHDPRRCGSSPRASICSAWLAGYPKHKAGIYTTAGSAVVSADGLVALNPPKTTTKAAATPSAARKTFIASASRANPPQTFAKR
jgi:hypothetical protein